MYRDRMFVAAVVLALTATACSGQPKASGGDPTPGNTAASDAPSPSIDPSTGATITPSAVAATPVGRATRSGDPKIVVTPPTSKSGVPEANLFTGAAITQGITKNKIMLCAHAGLTLASVFGNDPAQLEQTYWRMVNEEMGGVYGRSVEFHYEDDGYNPNNTPKAFTACQDRKPAIMIGGIGFDQTPTFRSLAEQNKELYIHGFATEKGTSNLKYSFGAAPSVEHMGKLFAQMVLKKAKGKKIGILTVSSDGWKGGADSFTSELRKLGYSAAIPRYEIADNNQVLTQHVVGLKDAGVEVAFINTNVVAWSRFVTEADGQQWHPMMVGWGFNLLTETVGQVMQSFPPSLGLSASPVYDPQTKYSWSAEYTRMQSYYKKYWNKSDPNDIDWIQWIAMKAFHRMLLDCGKDCNRNKIAGMMLSGYKGAEPPNCTLDFSRDPKHRVGGYLTNLWQTFDRGDTQAWKQISTCVAGF
ncbi:MAG: ABC transporter substrate-binding protein [Actinomycetota bacterium]